MKILITGSSGFIAKNLIAELENRGYKELLFCDRTTTREKLESYERIYADFTITFDYPAVAAVTLNNSCCRYISATEDKKKVHVRLRIPNRTCRTIWGQ